MANNLNASFPAQSKAPTAGYPYGSAQDITVSGDGTGTPWRAAIYDDILGFQQALLVAASIVPTGDPDEVGASQYLDALNVLIAAGVSGDYLKLDGTSVMTGDIHANLATFDIVNDLDGGLITLWTQTSGGTQRALQVGPYSGAALYHDGSVVTSTLTSATGGLRVKNELTGTGLERVLTVSDKSVYVQFPEGTYSSMIGDLVLGTVPVLIGETYEVTITVCGKMNVTADPGDYLNIKLWMPGASSYVVAGVSSFEPVIFEEDASSGLINNHMVESSLAESFLQYKGMVEITNGGDLEVRTGCSNGETFTITRGYMKVTKF